MTLDRDAWQKLYPIRSQLEVAFREAKMPLIGWVNERPEFREGYNVDWDKVEAIVTSPIKTKPKGRGKK